MRHIPPKWYQWLLLSAAATGLYFWFWHWFRPIPQHLPRLPTYLLGITPNFLGPTTFGAFFLFCAPFFGANRYKTARFDSRNYLQKSAINALVFLIFWEITQLWLIRAVFDWNDILWSGVGTIIYYRIAQKMAA